MKKFLIIIITFLFWSCQEEEIGNSNCVPVKLVDEICGNAIMEVLAAEYYGLTDATFQRTDGTILKNVFGTSIACLEGTKPEIGSTFYIEVVASESIVAAECVQCLAIFDTMPAKFHFIKLAKNCKQPGVENE